MTTSKTAANPQGTPDAAHSLDCRGLLCPLPVYKASMAMKQLETGQTLEIICTDLGSLEDFPAFARQGGHQLLSSTEENGQQTFHILKGGPS